MLRAFRGPREPAGRTSAGSRVRLPTRPPRRVSRAAKGAEPEPGLSNSGQNKSALPSHRSRGRQGAACFRAQGPLQPNISLRRTTSPNLLRLQTAQSIRATQRPRGRQSAEGEDLEAHHWIFARVRFGFDCRGSKAANAKRSRVSHGGPVSGLPGQAVRRHEDDPPMACPTRDATPERQG